jgi:hypothetical protein
MMIGVIGVPALARREQAEAARLAVCCAHVDMEKSLYGAVEQIKSLSL